MDCKKMLRWYVVAIVIIGTLFLIISPYEECFGKSHEWQYTDASGWGIRSIKKAEELGRVSKYEEKWDCCSFVMQQITNAGGFKLFYQMRWDSYVGWYAFALDVPEDCFLVFDNNSKFTMTAVVQGDTIRVDSERIVFTKGWGFKGLSVYKNQNAIVDNTNGSIQVKWMNRKDRNAYEWLRLESECEQGIDEYYIAGYIYFKETLKTDELNWSVSGINLYRR